jgi:hypothetical protein
MTCRRWLLCLVVIVTAPAHGWQLNERLKLFGTETWLPEDDLQRALEGSPAYDGSADLRTMFRDQWGNWRLIVDHTLLYQGGDTYAFEGAPENTIDQTPTSDARRYVDMTWTLEDGARHETLHRFDRLALEYRTERWGATIGRMAVSWGSGIVFQTIDLFAPFAPTTVDRDYKNGEDLVMVDGLAGGGDWQLLGVVRRNDEEQRTGSVDSFGGKWHSTLGSTEYEVIAGRHYRDPIVGFSLRHAIGGALVRTDWLYTDIHDGGDAVSGLVNIDYSFAWFQRNWYAFAEYFHNGFGSDRHPIDASELPEALSVRLQRGEVFTIMRDYLAVGTQIEWHPLLTHTLTLIANLHDQSSLLQTQLSYNASDAQLIEVGLVTNFGDTGDEYGAIPLGALAPGYTAGGGTQLYLRWTYYW